MTPFQRARNQEQKAERRARLVAAARELVQDETRLVDFSLNDLAAQAGMAKSNVYRYFESREAVLLDILSAEWAEWFQDLESTWPADLDDGATMEALAGHVAATLAKRALLCHLTAILPSVLEKNLSAPTIRAFKLSSLQFLRYLATHLATRAPLLDEARYLKWLGDLIVFITGLYPYARPNEAVRSALEDPALELFRPNFEGDLKRLLVAHARALGA